MFWVLTVFCISCASVKSPKEVSTSNDVPIITLEQDTIDLGTLKEGEQKEITIPFSNTGKQDLLIDIVTSCKCTSIDWPTQAIPPNGNGELQIVFDSSGFEGEVIKVVDIIGNTEPIVKEAWFKATIVK